MFGKALDTRQMKSQLKTFTMTTNYRILENIDFITKLLIQVFGLYVQLSLLEFARRR